MTPEELQRSVVLISSSDRKNNRFGTGFVVRQYSGSAYLLTCAHVVDDVGGSDKVQIRESPGNGSGDWRREWTGFGSLES